MKQTTVNEFKDGLNLDLHPLVTPKTVLTDNLNGTFITYNGNEFCLQNDRGNKEVAKLSKYYIPIGIKEHNGILYIVSYNPNDNTTEIGTYPGLDWSVQEETPHPLKYTKYTPLHNLDIREDFTTPYVILRNWNGEQRSDILDIFTRYGIEEYIDEIDNLIDNDESSIYFQINDYYNCWQELSDLGVFGYVMNIPPSELNYGGDAFRTTLFGFNTQRPVTIEVQDSYDGSVNLILVDGEHKNRLINTRFSVLPNNQYKLVTRKQTKPTNTYDTANLDQETLLIRTSNILTNIDLLEVQSGGQFKGGNYTFYIKFGDADFNQTDVVAESGIVSIFNGNDGVPSTISGTLLDERTDKMINLEITGLNHAYSKLYIYYSREYSDTQGYRMTEYGMLSEPIDMIIDGNVQSIWLTGFEQTTPINPETLNVDYHTVDWSRAEAQHSNMLFLGNIGSKETFKLYQNLDKFTKEHVIITARQLNTSLNTVSLDYTTGDEYYSTQNIYHKLGYWPDEIYRFGVVYILNDGSTTPVFNMTGGFFESARDNQNNIFYKIIENEANNPTNEYGVVLTPNVDIFKITTTTVDEVETSSTTVNPLYFNFELDEALPENVKGWFVVRQKRIPRTICQGLSIGIDEKSHLPLLKNESGTWDIESFLSYARDLPTNDELLEQINNLEDRSAQWRFWASLGVFVLSGLPFASTLGLIGTIDNLAAANELDNILDRTTEIPILEYLQTRERYIPEELTLAIISSNYTQEEEKYMLDNDISNRINDWEDAIIDITRFTQIASTDMVYSCTYTVYKYIREDNDDTFTWTLTETIPNVYYLTDDPQTYPTYLNFSYNNNSYYAIVTDAQDANEIEEFANGYYGSAEQIDVIQKRLITQDDSAIGAYGLLSLDPCVNSTVSGMLDGSKFKLIQQYDTKVNVNARHYNYSLQTKLEDDVIKRRCVYVQPNTNIKVIVDNNNSFSFSNVAGNAAEASQYKKVHTEYHVVRNSTQGDSSDSSYSHVSETNSNLEDLLEISNINIVRGYYCPYIGVATNSLRNPTLYSVRLLEQDADIKELMSVRSQDNSEYFCITDRTDELTIDAFRGDCYTNTVSIRINRNFIDPTAPVSEQIVDEKTWAKNVLLKKSDYEDALKGENKEKYTVKEAIWDQVNLADVNTVDLGMWVTFKCLSSYNLGLRSKDPFHTDETAILGSPRTFYPLNGASTATGNKMEESWLLNDGLSATVGRKRYNLMPDVPYSKSEFANRIMFSNVNITDAFTNGYRTFQGLSYKDYDKQYGAITKLISLGQNLFVVMEHGLGLVPVNPKALMQTTTGEAIHIYGYGVLPDEMTIISQDYGSKYEHSVIRTPIGIYGIDVDAKKIWRFSDKQGFETISDMKIETYLKDYLEPLIIEMGLKDIRSNYNGKKGDLMFTWNDKHGEYLYSICYNERQNLWTTRYDWKPIVSENINDEFYSLHKDLWPNEGEENYCRIWEHADDVGYWDEHVSQWYNDKKWFEFEFVVSDPIGVNKIFDNLQIISNNVQPNEMEITVIGDDYEFKRTPVELNSSRTDKLEVQTDDPFVITTTSNVHGQIPSRNMWRYHFDKRLNQSAITKWQPFKDIYKFGRRIGNIQYKEGSWYAQIEPLLINPRKEARIRDKWAKIRIKYYGKDLAIITAIKTLINI